MTYYVSPRETYTGLGTSNRDTRQNEEIRVVLLGRTGNGKSASGNTILNHKAFKSERSPSSVTFECEKARGVVDGSRVAVVDTPGLYDTKSKEDEVMRKLKECICLCAPGPHAFLIVINLTRFTQEEQKTVELLQMSFGEKAADYSMVLFTHGDQLEGTIEDFFFRSRKLSYLIRQCNWRYHVLNNKVPDNRQVSQLLAKIVRMVSENGGTFYTNEMLQRAERAIQEQVVEIIKKNAEQRRLEEIKLRAKYEGERLQVELNRFNEEREKKTRERAEKMNKFLETGLILTSAEVGVAIGAAAGTVGGPVGIGVGAVVGGVAGVVVGILAPKAAIALREKCIVQ